MLYGRMIALMLIGMGVIFVVLNVSLASDAGFFFGDFAVAGPALVTAGVAMLVFPGPPMTLKEVREGQANGEDVNQRWISEAPLSHKIAWAIGGAIGLGAGFFLESLLMG